MMNLKLDYKQLKNQSYGGFGETNNKIRMLKFKNKCRNPKIL
jgi:hypothetical protein